MAAPERGGKEGFTPVGGTTVPAIGVLPSERVPPPTGVRTWGRLRALGAVAKRSVFPRSVPLARLLFCLVGVCRFPLEPQAAPVVSSGHPKGD